MITESGAERFRRGGVKPVRRNAGGWLMQSVTKRSDMDLHMSIEFLHVPPLPTVLPWKYKAEGIDGVIREQSYEINYTGFSRFIHLFQPFL